MCDNKSPYIAIIIQLINPPIRNINIDSFFNHFDLQINNAINIIK